MTRSVKYQPSKISKMLEALMKPQLHNGFTWRAGIDDLRGRLREALQERVQC